MNRIAQCHLVPILALACAINVAATDSTFAQTYYIRVVGSSGAKYCAQDSVKARAAAKAGFECGTAGDSVDEVFECDSCLAGANCDLIGKADEQILAQVDPLKNTYHYLVVGCREVFYGVCAETNFCKSASTLELAAALAGQAAGANSQYIVRSQQLSDCGSAPPDGDPCDCQYEASFSITPCPPKPYCQPRCVPQCQPKKRGCLQRLFGKLRRCR